MTKNKRSLALIARARSAIAEVRKDPSFAKHRRELLNIMIDLDSIAEYSKADACRVLHE